MNGHIILREDGDLSIAKSIKGNVIEPHSEERRVRSKSALGMLQMEDDETFEVWLEEMDEKGVDQQRLVTAQLEAYESVSNALLPSRSMIRKAEVQYTKDVELIWAELTNSGQPLQVVHNVSLDDVKRNIDKWKASAIKEFGKLKDNK